MFIVPNSQTRIYILTYLNNKIKKIAKHIFYISNIKLSLLKYCYLKYFKISDYILKYIYYKNRLLE